MPQQFKIDGVDDIEIEVMTAKTRTRYHVVQLGNGIYSLTIETAGRDFLKGADAAATKFFESFRFPTPQVNDAPGITASAAEP
jgi:hypothetical protein